MTIKSIVQLLAQADADIPDNTTGLVEPSDVRVLIKDFLDTISPAYGSILAASAVVALTTTPARIAPFSSTVAATAGYYSANLTNGEVTRAIATAGLAGATDFIIVQGDVAYANGVDVTIELFKNGVATGFKTTVTGRGAANKVSFNLAALSYTATVDAVFDVRASSSAANSATFTDVVVLAQAQPVRSFV